MFLDVVTNIQRHKIQRKRYPWCWDTLNLNKRKPASEVHKFHLEPFVAHKVLRRNPSRNWLILIFSGEKPCTRIIQNILHSFIHFSRAKDVISHPKLNERKFLMGAGEHECQISQNYILHMKFSEFYLRFHNSCEIWHSFSQTPMRNFLWCYYRRLITSWLASNQLYFKTVCEVV